MKVFVVAGLTCVLFSAPVLAWESDVHFGLTKWLALEAGFSEPDARLIAGGTLNMDHGLFDARHLVVHYACFGRDEQASQLVRDSHFPSFAKLPDLPPARKVDPGGKAARRRALQEVAPLTHSEGERAFELGKFGEALHALQDSWSHQGVPDTPRLAFLSCSERLSWAHPADRGGWASHDADLTSRYPADTLDTAKATYEFLDAYLEKRGWPRSAKSWAAIEGEVRDFAPLATKTAKKAWFVRHGFTDVEFLDETTLEDGEETFGYSARLAHAVGKVPPNALVGKGALDVPREVHAFFQTFFDAWLTQPSPGPVLERFIGMEQAVQHLRAQGRNPEAGPDLVAAQLWMWRVRDHGLVNKLGHGLGGPKGKEGFGALREAFAARKALTDFKTADDALIPFAPGTPPYLLVRVPGSSKASAAAFAALVRFKHAPHDVVIVSAAKGERGWRIVAINWTVDH
ncbi:hypothetical protein [Candidatus Nitrospira bockiana]